MPYQSIDELPSAVRNRYDEKGQRAFLSAFNRAVYDEGLPEERAFAIAHAAAKRADGTVKRVKARRLNKKR